MIYFIRALGTDYVKIGTTGDNVGSRLANLQTASPHPLAVEAVLDGGREAESAMHRRVRARNVHGEWFRLSPAEVEGLCNSSLEIKRPEVSSPENARHVFRILGLKMLRVVAMMRAIRCGERDSLLAIEALGSRLVGNAETA